MGSHVDAWKKLRYLLEEEDRIEYTNIDHNRWESSPWSDSGRKKEPDPNKADTGKRCHWRAIKSVVRFAAV